MNSPIRHMRITVDGKAYDVTVELLDETPGRPVGLSTPPVGEGPVAVPSVPPVERSTTAESGSGAVVAPLAATVLSVDVAVGRTVRAGDALVTLEAMKMKTHVRAPRAGVVRRVDAQVGQAVEEGASLLMLGDGA